MGGMLDDIAAEYLAKPEWAEVAALYYSNIQRGIYPEEWVDAIVQRHTEIRLTDCVYFAQIWSEIQFGNILHAPIYVGDAPRGDSAQEENQAILDRFVSNQQWDFEARFYGGAGDNDGFFRWVEPKHFFNTKRDDVEQVGSNRIPLEVGYTNAGTTWLHIWMEGGVARWPYGSDKIWVFVKSPKWPHSLDYPRKPLKFERFSSKRAQHCIQLHLFPDAD